ncbi:hypothetical protein [Streptococcus intermedius]|uniref:hypothetical protein n=1 Tax=Streptococcus intermedius TaxID=1338 RepID=UPI000F661BB1|nr:hypothetical protein [Streptococcus intermedius]RSJ13903.1 hypothetical protein D8832_03135 [Streptococcus intermedius]
MKQQIIDLLSKQEKVSIVFVNGENLIFSNVVNVLDSDNLIELSRVDGSPSVIININHICYIKSARSEKAQVVKY